MYMSKELTAGEIDEKKEKLLSDMRMTTVPGCSWVYYKDGKLIEEVAVGVTDNSEAKALVTSETRLSVASLSKACFAYLVLKLIESNQFEFNLDTPLCKLVDYEELENTEYGMKVTVKMVLQHRTGLPNGKADDEPLLFDFEPGTEYGYSGLGIHWLQKAVVKVTGKGLEALAIEWVFHKEKVNMPHSTYIPENGDAEDAHSANTLRTTPQDYARLVQAWRSDQGLKKLFDPFKFDSNFTMEKDGWANGILKQLEGDERAELQAALKQVSSGLGLLLIKTSDGRTMGCHNGDMNGKRALVVFDVNDPNGELFVFVSSAVKEAAQVGGLKSAENGYTLLADTPFSRMDVGPLRTYMREKYAFALDINEENWSAKQDIRGSRIGKYFAEMLEHKVANAASTVSPGFGS